MGEITYHWDSNAPPLPDLTVDPDGTISFRLRFNSRDVYGEPILYSDELTAAYKWCKEQGPFQWLGYDTNYHRIRFDNIRDAVLFKLYWS